jgi:hypothetical protein
LKTSVLFIATLLLAQLAAPSPVAAPVKGYGPWRLGMTREQVSAVAEGAPYVRVPSTGGIETRNGTFAGRKTTVSFVFGDGTLRIIQIWAYEGKDAGEAIAAFYRVYEHLEKTRGSVQVTSVSLPPHADAGAFANQVRSALSSVPGDQGAKLQISPVSKSPDLSIFSSLIRHPRLGYYVFLYYRLPETGKAG